MELFGVDPEGPESNEFDQGDVNVPTLDVNLSEEALQELQQDDPLQWSPNYGLDVYLRIRALVRSLATGE